MPRRFGRLTDEVQIPHWIRIHVQITIFESIEGLGVPFGVMPNSGIRYSKQLVKTL
jgi:hypothetical protein